MQQLLLLARHAWLLQWRALRQARGVLALLPAMRSERLPWMRSTYMLLMTAAVQQVVLGAHGWLGCWLQGWLIAVREGCWAAHGWLSRRLLCTISKRQVLTWRSSHLLCVIM